MKRYLLFVVKRYYPSGGWEDFRGDFDTADAAAMIGHELSINTPEFDGDWIQIVDTTTMKDIYEPTYKHFK